MKVKEGKNTPSRKQHLASQPAAEIRFYRANEKPWGVLSNLYRCEVRIDDEVFPSAEHAYQAGKPRKKTVREWILNAPSPSLVAMAGWCGSFSSSASFTTAACGSTGAAAVLASGNGATASR
jgi:predicted NAD-dependent protein-ADP-ribosyltransferase YbiA (DUF1768 family)